MRIFAYCCASFAEATRKAAGVEPLLSPPLTATRFEPRWLETCNLVYLDLHGQPGSEFWLGDGGIIALAARQVRKANLSGVVVFATNCYLADKGSPMLDALLDAGARYVIGGEGVNWATSRRPAGAAELGWRFRQLFERGIEPMKALAIAKHALAARSALRWKRKERLVYKDTLAFRAYYRRRV